MALAIVHVLGVLLASISLALLIAWIAAWEQERVKKRRLQEMSMALGVPQASLERDDLAPRLLEYVSQRYSGELLRNRLSDLCGAIRTTWGWLGSLLQVAVVLLVGWTMYEKGSDNAVHMWWALAVAVFFWIASMVFSFACLLLTGRYPGEAKVGRKIVAAAIEQMNATAVQSSAKPLASAWEN